MTFLCLEIVPVVYARVHQSFIGHVDCITLWSCLSEILLQLDVFLYSNVNDKIYSKILILSHIYLA